MSDLRDLQIRRLDCAVDESRAIANRLESMGETIELILSDVDDLQRTFHSVRLGLFRHEAEASAVAVIEPAAGPWTPYSVEAYERLKDTDGLVLCDPGDGRYMVAERDIDGWWYSGGDVCDDCPQFWTPHRIARINPPQGVPDNAE